MPECESCKRPYSLEPETYCVPKPTEYGILCHQCIEWNASDMKIRGYATHVSGAIHHARGEANAKQWSEMMREATKHA